MKCMCGVSSTEEDHKEYHERWVEWLDDFLAAKDKPFDLSLAHKMDCPICKTTHTMAVALSLTAEAHGWAAMPCH